MPTTHRWWILATLLLSFTPIVVDATILHISIPSLTLALKASGTDILWIIDIYPLMMAGLLVPMGTLADRVGPKRMLMVGLGIFMIASTLAAFAPSALVLIAARALQAIGGSMVMPTILALIRHLFTDNKERGIALGLWGTVASAGAAIGPIAGGALLEHFWWGSVFLINLPIILLLLPLIALQVPEFRTHAHGPWKIGHAIILIIGLLAAVYGLKSLIGAKILWWQSLAFIGSGVMFIVYFIQLQRRDPVPMLDMSLFSIRPLAIGIGVAVIVCAALAGTELTIAQELQFVLGKSPLQAGLFMLPLMIASGVGGPIAGWAVGRFGLRAVMSLSILASGAALFGLAITNFEQAGLFVILCFLVLGIALSMGMTSSSIAIMDNVSPDKAGAAGSLEGTGYEFGMGLGIAFFGGILTALYRLGMDAPTGTPLHAQASIGETFTYAQGLSEPLAEPLKAAGRLAFSGAHMWVLSISAAMLTVLAAIVWFLLRPTRQTD